MTSSDRGAKAHGFTPKVSVPERHPVQFKDPTLSIWLSKVWLSTFQLTTVAGAAVIAKSAVAPLERVKILMQVGPVRGYDVRRGGKGPFQGIWACLQHMAAKDGWRSLYRGNGINVLRVVPEVLLKFSIHDQLRVIVGATSMDSAQLPVSSRIAAGALTGVLRTALLHPLSVVRTRLTADMGDPAPRAARQRTHPGSSRHFSGIAQCVRETWQRERLRGFFGGFALASVASAPYLAVCFPVYELLVQTLPTEKQSVREWWYPFAKMGCATGAGIAATLATYPIDTVRRRMEVRGSPGYPERRIGRTTLACVNNILRYEGVQAFYRGALVTCMKCFPSTVFQCLAYDALKSAVMMVDPSTAASARL